MIYDNHVRYSIDKPDGIKILFTNPFKIVERDGMTATIDVFDDNGKYFNIFVNYLESGDVELTPPPPKDGIVYFIY